jgi:hypothetical protein
MPIIEAKANSQNMDAVIVDNTLPRMIKPALKKNNGRLPNLEK